MVSTRSFYKTHAMQVRPITHVLFIPHTWSLYVVKRNRGFDLFYLVSKIYKFNFLLPSGSYAIRYPSSGLICLSFHKPNQFLLLFFQNIKKLLFIFNVPFFKKIKFRGKGYYIYKNSRNTITPQFGFAHRIYMYSYFNVVKFLSKVKVFIFGLLKCDVWETSRDIKSKRPINIFTGRGVRFARQIIYKKVGKVSSYR